MKVFVTGGTGFLGQSVCRSLARAGHQIYALTRDSSRIRQKGVEAVVGNLADVTRWEEALKVCDACVHMVGILREQRSAGQSFERIHYQGTVDIVKACSRNGVQRFIHLSANGVEKGLDTPYMRTKALAEQAVQSSGLDWTILRPSLIYAGESNQQNFVSTIQGNLDALPMFPYFGDGSYRMSPVSAKEVGDSVVAALAQSSSIKKIYHLCGNETYTYKALLHLINEVGKYRCKFFGVPLWLATSAGNVLGSIPGFPITGDMVKMLAAGNASPVNALTQADLGVAAVSFKDWLQTGSLPAAPEMTPIGEVVLSAPVTTHLQAEDAPPIAE